MINNSKTKKETYRALFIPLPHTKANPEYTLFFKLFSIQGNLVLTTGLKT